MVASPVGFWSLNAEKESNVFRDGQAITFKQKLTYTQTMTYENKVRFEQEMNEERARIAIADWMNCPIYELEHAATVFESALLLLITRYANY